MGQRLGSDPIVLGTMMGHKGPTTGWVMQKILVQALPFHNAPSFVTVTNHCPSGLLSPHTSNKELGPISTRAEENQSTGKSLGELVLGG